MSQIRKPSTAEEHQHLAWKEYCWKQTTFLLALIAVLVTSIKIEDPTTTQRNLLALGWFLSIAPILFNGYRYYRKYEDIE